MSLQPKNFYEFGAYRIDARDHLLLRDGEVVPLAPKAFDLLLVLAQSSGRVLTKEELMKLVWPDSFVEEANLSRHVFTLRKALDEDGDANKYIETIPRRGYRFVAGVTEVRDESDELVVAEHSRSRIVIEQTEAPNLAADYPGSDRTGRVLTLAAGTRRRTVLLALGCAGTLVLAVAFYFWKTGNTVGEPTSTGVKSIAVLPFKPLVVHSRNESLETGMAETLITKLSGITRLIVRPLSAIRKYTGLEQDSIAAGRELGVDYVLEGNLQMEGEKVRATVRLLSVKDGRAIWTDKFDEKSTDRIFPIQDSISRQVALALVPKLTGEEQRQLAKRYTDNTEAYNLYLTGRFFWNRFNEEGLKKAIEYFNQAIAIDPNYALAYTGLAGVYNVQGALGMVPPAQTWSKAKWAAEKAVELDDKLAKAHQVLGTVKLMYEWDWPGAERELTRAMELNPTDGEPHNLYAYYYEAKGQLDKGLSEMRRAQELAPISAVINADVASSLYYQGNYEEAINAWRKAEEINPNFGLTPLCLPAQIYEQKGEYDRAIAECQKAFSVFGRDPGILGVLGYTYAVSGKRREAQNILAEIESLWNRRYFSPIDVALVYAGLGDRDGGLAWLTKAYDARDPQLIWVNVEPELKSLHTDPRFRDLLRRIGLESSVN